MSASATATERVIEAMRADPSLVGEFLADLGGDPDQYGVPDRDWSAASPEDLGETFLEHFLRVLMESSPEVAGSFTGIDFGEVDRAAVGGEVASLLMDPRARDF